MARCPKCNENIPYVKIISRSGKPITCNRCESKLKVGKQPLFISVILVVILNVILFYTDITDKYGLQVVSIIVLFIGTMIIGIKWMKLEPLENPRLYKYENELKNLSSLLVMLSILVPLLAVFAYMSFFVMDDAFWKNTGIVVSIITAVLAMVMICWLLKRQKLKVLIKKEKEDTRLREILKR